MTYWLVLFSDGSTGYQVMGGADTVVIDMDGNILTGKLEYTTIDTAPPEPYPEVIYV